jgi:two-component system, NtrC family, response regulator PilR
VLQKKINILIVDDDRSIRDMMSIVLKKEGYAIIEAESAPIALSILKDGDIDLIISDIKMPEVSGIELLKKIKMIKPELPVLLITAYSSTNDAVEVMRHGADDYIIKPFNLEELKIIILKTLKKNELEKENAFLKQSLEKREKFENIVGTNRAMIGIFNLIDSIANTDSTVLVCGESGTGKELIARAIHNKSNRTNDKFISINCGALPETLLESELFGHVRGAFTDAYRDKMGLFKMAETGTLFLDEISETSLSMQVKLLRVLQERKIRPVGGNEEIDIDVRVIAATNKNLQEGIRQGSFRSDLFYRLNVISIEIPPLRERKEDIPILMNYFLSRFNQKMKKHHEGFSKEVIELFLSYNWPGNVRELENFIERSVALEKSTVISIKSLPAELLYSFSSIDSFNEDWHFAIKNKSFGFNEYIDGISKKIILTALEINDGNIKKTAENLKLNYRSTRYLIEKYGLKFKTI